MTGASRQAQNLEAALAVARLGFAVFPCRPDSVPLLKDWPNRASTDEAIIRGWWQQFPSAIPAIACGASGLLVVDCDVKKGKDGINEWRANCQENGFDPSPCPIVETRSGGQHFYFRQLPGMPLGNTVGTLSAGIDTRGAGGYVIAAGAALPDGSSYRIISGSLLDIPNLPNGLHGYLSSLKNGPKVEPQAKIPHADILVVPEDRERERPYALSALQQEADTVSAATEGTRNDALFKAALKIGSLLPLGGISTDEAKGALTDAGISAGLDRAEIRATIHSGFEKGSANPRQSLAQQDAQLRRGVEILGADGAVPPSKAVSLPPKWRDPKPLPPELAPVQAFNRDFMPVEAADWVMDIAERMQCPPDFIGVSVIAAFGSTIGRQIAIRPKRLDTWSEYPNLWALVIGRPGVMKSPAMGEALKPLKALEKKAYEAYTAEMEAYRTALDEFELRSAATKRKNTKALEKDLDGSLSSTLLKAPDQPKCKRFIVTDATYEALGEIVGANPNGVLVHRDEVMSLLKMLDREENIAARGFFLSGWTGNESYTFDRITRSGARIEAVCLSILGSTQPGRIMAYIAPALRGGAADDGMIQRFGLTVWPDMPSEWKFVERSLNVEARNRAFQVFERLSRLSHTNIGATIDTIDECAFVGFDDEASEIFAEWLTKLERQLRSSELHPALESHFSKYRKLVPALALINQLVDCGSGAVGRDALERAIAFSEYLASHARRLYGAGLRLEVVTAQAILARIRKGELTDGFTARDILQNDWAKLTDREQVIAGLALLVDHDWLVEQITATGGRPRTVYIINPKVNQ